MRVKDLMSLKKCERNVRFNHLVEEKNKRKLLLARAVTEMCEHLKKKEDLNSIIETLRSNLSYEESWFESSWQKTTYENDDLVSFSRFLQWFFSQKFNVLEANVSAVAVTDKPFYQKDSTLTQNVSLVAEKNGKFHSFLISPEVATHTPGGRSLLTNTSTQLEVMVTKEYLEHKYPQITVSTVHLRSELDEDGSMWPEFSIAKTKKSNLLVADFSDFLSEDGTLDMDIFHDKLQEVVNLPTECSCFDCKNAYFCNMKSIDKGIVAESNETEGYKLPCYTEEQAEVISSVNGPMVVCAGPGSGKTATLVGRVKHMIDLGIKPENILVITYTKKAAGELEERISAFCSGTDFPYIGTINKLGNDILLQNKRLLGKNVRLLSSTTKLSLIDNLLTALPKLEGIKYGKKYGRTGLLKTVERKLDTFFELGDYEAFRKKEPKLGDDFVMFAQMYKEAICASDFITYDEQITLCTQLLYEHPELLEQYQELYRYIMVDEFQDVNSDNAEFIYLLADKYKNLCVVGDDDQSVYGFRGGDIRFMLEFPKRFEGAKEFVLGANFRSSEEIVEFSKGIVTSNVRIEKDIRATRGHGEIPMKKANNSPAAIEELIRSIVNGGKYSYGDIAVLSTKNAPLQELHEALTIPTVLAKQPLRNEPLFLVISSILSLYFKGYEDRYIATLLYVLFPNEAESVYRAEDMSLYETIRSVMPDITDYGYYHGEGDGFYFSFLSLVSRCLEIVSQGYGIKETVAKVAELLNVTDSAALETINESLIEERGIDSLQALSEHMEYMCLMEDDEKVELAPNDAVLLITSHESKGKEFPVVILQDGDSYEDEPERRRLLYVASTRAKDLLVICYDAKKGMALTNGLLIQEKEEKAV